MKILDTSELASASGLPASTLRYYEERGLIASVGRRGLKRLFDARTLDLLDAISLARWAGFTLEDIRDWISPDGALHVDRDRLNDRAAEVEDLATRLESLAQMLRHTAACPETDHFDCPKFRQMLRAARRHRPGAAPLSASSS